MESWTSMACLLGWFLLGVLPAESAGLSVCNKNSFPFAVAFTYHRPNMPPDHLNTKGWFNVEPNTCKTVMEGGIYVSGYVGVSYDRQLDGTPVAAMLSKDGQSAPATKRYCVTRSKSFDNAGTEADLANCDGRSGWYLMPFSVRYDAPERNTETSLDISLNGVFGGVSYLRAQPQQGGTLGRVKAGEIKRAGAVPLADAVYDLFYQIRARGTKLHYDVPVKYASMVGSFRDAKVLTCVYEEPSTDVTSRSFYFWSGGIPLAFDAALQAQLPKEHPIFEIGPARTACPLRNPDLE